MQAPNWTRLNDTLNKLRIGLSNAFAKVQQAENIASKEVERAKAVLEKRRREIASKAAEMERQNGARNKAREGWCNTFSGLHLFKVLYYKYLNSSTLLSDSLKLSLVL